MDEIRELIRLIDESKIEEFEVDNDGSKLVIKKSIDKPQITKMSVPMQETVNYTPVEMVAASPMPIAEQVVQQPLRDENENFHKILSPMVGTFYRASSPEAGPYVKIGDQISENDVVCIIEAMKLMNEIEAEVKGQVMEVLVENGQIVEYGQPLFLLKV